MVAEIQSLKWTDENIHQMYHLFLSQVYLALANAVLIFYQICHKELIYSFRIRKVILKLIFCKECRKIFIRHSASGRPVFNCI